VGGRGGGGIRKKIVRRKFYEENCNGRARNTFQE
jgi:hypothetical protein